MILMKTHKIVSQDPLRHGTPCITGRPTSRDALRHGKSTVHQHPLRHGSPFFLPPISSWYPRKLQCVHIFKKEMIRKNWFWKTHKTVCQEPLRHGTPSFFNLVPQTQKVTICTCFQRRSYKETTIWKTQTTVSQDPLRHGMPPASQDALRQGTPCVTAR